MTDSAGLVLSVRGDATLPVPADSARLSGALSVLRGSKPEALAEAAAALHRLIGDLASLGGVALTVDTERAPLTWLARSATSWAETHPDKSTGRNEPTGRITATVSVHITVRDFDMLTALGAQLSSHQDLHIHDVRWQVDTDNPGWAQVRAAAIHAALRKGSDYAAALGVSVVEVLHVADAGLLDGNSGRDHTGHALSAAMFSGGAPSDAPSLDPEPQELTATIDARLRATAVTLPAT